MSLSLIAKSIKASPTLKLNEKFAILKEKGDPVIHLGGGEPKTKVPMDAILATVAHVNTGEVRYAPADGIPALKQAIIRYTEEFYERKVKTGKRYCIRRSKAGNYGCTSGNIKSAGRSSLPCSVLGKLS